ncbi:MAG: fatty acid desaturase [Alphaproteobacteria bacterium]
MAALADYTRASEQELMQAEREIMAKYQGGVSWIMVAWGIGNCLVWLALWPLVLTGILPLWAGFIIATVNTTIAYLPSHEAQHDIYARPGEKLRWLNQFVGHFSLIPLAASFYALRETHMDHHKYANDPARDPDYPTAAPSAWAAVKKSIAFYQPGNKDKKRYGEVLAAQNTPAAHKAILHSILWQLFYYGFLAAMAWSGFALEAALLWWLPRQIGYAYIRFYLSWMPHHPAQQTGRYNDTRAFKSKIGNIGSLGMQYHILHHLHPRIPLPRHARLYREIKPVLEARRCELGGL